MPKDAIMRDYLRSNDYMLPAYRKTIDVFVDGSRAVIAVVSV